MRVMLPCLSAAGLAVRALHSRTPPRVESAARAYGARVVSEYDALLADPAIELICIAVPPALHRAMATAAIEAGKHVLCEKPLAPTAVDAAAMADAGRGATTLQAVDHELRFHPNLIRLRRLIQNGDVGAVSHVQLRYSSSTRVNPALLWDWWSDAAQGGGQLNALGSHMVDALRWWLDDDVVSATGRLAVSTAVRRLAGGGIGPVTADEHTEFRVQFSRGVEAVVVVSAVDPADRGLRVEVVGDAGTLVLDGFDSLRLAVHGDPPFEISTPDPLLGQPDIGLNAWRTSLVRYGQHLAACIREGVPFDGATFNDGVAIQCVLDAVRASAGAPVFLGAQL